MEKKVSWPIVFWLAAIHVGALTAPLNFTWPAFALFVGLSIATGMAITLGYHRLLTHGSFETFPIVRYAIALVGTLAGQGTPLTWVSNHRIHHKFSDIPHVDPHTPRDGLLWSHLVWNLYSDPDDWRAIRHFCPDLANDRFMVFLHRTHLMWHFVLGGILLAIGGWPWLVYGMFLRLAVVLNFTWMVNSVCHGYGYRLYQTRDDSTNNVWLALPTYGESFHNSHHAFPSAADHGWSRWYEIDVTYVAIRLMEKVGLAWNVKTRGPK